MTEPTVQCEQCDEQVSESDAKLITERGVNGHRVTLAFCPRCQR